MHWLASRPEVDPQRIAVGGLIAGGGLPASPALLARERGGGMPAFQRLVYPMLGESQAAGVPCALEVVFGANQGFDAAQSQAPVVRAFDTSKIQALSQALGVG